MTSRSGDDPDLTYRKIQVVGKSSLAITIPKKWAEKLGFKPGVHVLLRKVGSSIVVTPVQVAEDQESSSNSKRAEIVILPDNPWRALRKLVSCYLAGYREVTIRLPEGAEGLRLLVKEFIRNKLSGTEIIQEDEHTLNVRFIAEGGLIPFRYLLNQMCENVVSILRGAIAEISHYRGRHNRSERSPVQDDEVDRLYLLTLRQVNVALADENLRLKMGVRTPRELIAIVSVAKSLERCGDHATRVAYLYHNLLAVVNEKSSEMPSLERLAELSSLTCTILRDSVYSFITGNTELAQEILDQRRVELRKFSISIINNIVRSTHIASQPLSDTTTYLVLILESIRRILAYSYDIAEITVDTYSVH